MYVDDLLIASTSEQQIEHTAKVLGKTFQLTDLGKIKHYLGIEVKTDNNGFYLISNRFTKRTKHMDTKYHFVKDLSEKHVFNYMYCATEEMLADMLTKPLSRIKLQKLRKKCELTI